MPFKAILNGKPIISLDFTDQEWEQLRNDVKKGKVELKLPCCGGPAYLRTSKLGTKHFVHKRGHRCKNWKPESLEHMRLKEIIYRVCVQEGWKTDVERIMPSGEIADVYCEKDGRKIVFEVQLSYQTLDKFRERQKKYINDGVRAYWLFKPPKRDSYIYFNPPDKQLPIFALEIDKNSSDFQIEVASTTLSVETFVKYVLEGRIRFKDRVVHRKTKIIVDVYKAATKCWKCKRVINVVFPYSDEYVSWSWFGMSKEEEAIWRQIAKLQRQGVRFFANVGPIKYRYSKTVGEKYWMNTCKYCGAKVGNFFLKHEIIPEVIEDEYLPKIKIEVKLSHPINILVSEAEWYIVEKK